MSGEDGADIMVVSVKRKKYSIEVRTKIVFHPIEE